MSTFDGEIAGAAATTNSTGLHVVGVATVLNLNATNATAGVITATTFDGELSGAVLVSTGFMVLFKTLVFQPSLKFLVV